MIFGVKWIALLSAACVLLLPRAAVAAIPQLTALSRVDSVGTAYTSSGNVRIELREVRTEAMGLKGPRPLSVLVIFEPESGAFSWRVTAADLTNPSWRIAQFKDGQAAFLKDGEIVDSRSLGTGLFVRTYRGHASNMDDAEAQALKGATASIDPGNLEKSQCVHVVPLVPLNNDFVSPPGNAFSSVLAPSVIDVQWNGDGQHWIVTLQGRWKAEITLDANYNLVSMKKVK